MRNGATLLIAATVCVLAAVAVVDALRSSPAPSAAATAPPTTGAPTVTTRFPFASRRGEIEDIGNTWARLYAAGDPKGCSYMDRALCRLEPLPRFRESFEGATVQDIGFLNGHDACALFSNGICVEFWGDGGTWTVIKVAADGPRFFQ